MSNSVSAVSSPCQVSVISPVSCNSAPAGVVRAVSSEPACEVTAWWTVMTLSSDNLDHEMLDRPWAAAWCWTTVMMVEGFRQQDSQPVLAPYLHRSHQ